MNKLRRTHIDSPGFFAMRTHHSPETSLKSCRARLAAPAPERRQENVATMVR